MKTFQVALLENHNNCNAITEKLKKRLEMHDLDGDKEGTRRQFHTTTTVESSKRKFEERLALSRAKENKRRIVMMDFYDMPKSTNDPRAPTREHYVRVV
ncbi:hypothetical protein H5410_013267 [Solanum commersonii]|uniref:Uncharacterized protein n=1 Tax=Solanum commersonii TaxID=4109 RepID=A0A9J6AUM6_SOLCO|nr:hypothetical protein H5410_013267 [Solanum commersonii]